MSEERQKVVDAVKQISKERSELLKRYGIALEHDDVEESYGLWIVPAVHHGSLVAYKSLELNRALEDMQQQLESLTGSGISILLNPEN